MPPEPGDGSSPLAWLTPAVLGPALKTPHPAPWVAIYLTLILGCLAPQGSLSDSHGAVKPSKCHGGSGCFAGAVTGFSHELPGLPGKALVEGMLLVGMEPGPGVS